MTTDDDKDMLAAEYVLGTLEGEERAAVEARRGEDAVLDAAITAWEERLSPLLERVSEAAPGDLLPGVLARLDAARRPHAAPRSAPSAEVVALRSRLARWRASAIVATAAAAGLAAVVVWRGPAAPDPDQRYVAVFQDNDRQPAFILSMDLDSREITIRPVDARPQPGKTYQLWIASDRLGSSPRSLGLLESAQRPTRKRLAEFDAELLRAATYGISLEPAGGSPTGSPTGPAIHGRLIPSAP